MSQWLLADISIMCQTSIFWWAYKPTCNLGHELCTPHWGSIFHIRFGIPSGKRCKRVIHYSLYGNASTYPEKFQQLTKYHERSVTNVKNILLEHISQRYPKAAFQWHGYLCWNEEVPVCEVAVFQWVNCCAYGMCIHIYIYIYLSIYLSISLTTFFALGWPSKLQR